ncbi:hypothetical protein ACYFX5_12685 [Bremerella sp. T1]|uniref:hypothetical protein n=1 Tax=Bremerella sp. TYQ1 TaxID=3119568 RepID=UPI001CCC3E9D|nr:hypothetical protein [Bremerella volcania]UBM33916.1 hypothetical protein LA756_14630 [Bremerella volcania]
MRDDGIRFDWGGADPTRRVEACQERSGIGFGKVDSLASSGCYGQIKDPRRLQLLKIDYIKRLGSRTKAADNATQQEPGDGAPGKSYSKGMGCHVTEGLHFKW